MDKIPLTLIFYTDAVGGVGDKYQVWLWAPLCGANKWTVFFKEHLDFRLIGPEKKFPWFTGECQLGSREVLEDEMESQLKQKNKNNRIVGDQNKNKSYGQNSLKDKTRANLKIHDERTEWVGKKVEEAMGGMKTSKRDGRHGGNGQSEIRLGGDLTETEAREWRTRWREVAAMSKRQS